MIRKFTWPIAATIGAMLLPLSVAYAGVVDYAATSLGGNNWRYDYTVNNTTPSIGFDELTVYFDISKYELIWTPTAPAGWDPILVQPDAGIPADGFYDVLSFDGFVNSGASISGFSVSFAYLSTGTPGAQPFELLDSSAFSVVYSGITQPLGSLPPVPEPSSLFLMMLGLSVAFAIHQLRTCPSRRR